MRRENLEKHSARMETDLEGIMEIQGGALAISEADVTFTVQQFMQYLADVGRSNKCPVCPHQGSWEFHTTLADSNQVLVHIVQKAGKSQEYTPVATMECPRCGFISQTSLIAVMLHFQGGEND